MPFTCWRDKGHEICYRLSLARRFAPFCCCCCCFDRRNLGPCAIFEYVYIYMYIFAEIFCWMATPSHYDSSQLAASSVFCWSAAEAIFWAWSAQCSVHFTTADRLPRIDHYQANYDTSLVVYPTIHSFVFPRVYFLLCNFIRLVLGQSKSFG